MPIANEPKNPVVLSYLALRKSVGFVALGLPFALVVPWLLVHGAPLESSISSYYYTGMRNLFVGSLCAIAMFMLCCRGYDRKDEIAGILSAICAVGVAFFPTEPDGVVTPAQHTVSIVHYTCAAVLFLTLAYFCLVLFRLSASVEPTLKKKQRNAVYKVCGWAIVASIVLLAVLKLLGIGTLPGGLATTLVFETTSLLSFGVAWMVKGEVFLKDNALDTSAALTTDGRTASGNAA